MSSRVAVTIIGQQCVAYHLRNFTEIIRVLNGDGEVGGYQRVCW